MTRSANSENELFRLGQLAFEAGKLETARNLFQQVVALHGDHRKAAERYLTLIQQRLRRGREKSRPYTEDGGRGNDAIEHVAPIIPQVVKGAGTGVRKESTYYSWPTRPRPKPPEPTAPEALWRTPHMVLTPPPPVQSNACIHVLVYIDTDALREGEEGEVVAVQFPKGQSWIDINVWLVVEEPFSVEGPDSQKLTLRRNQQQSNSVVFTVIRNSPGTATSALFSALFAYRGRPCGRVSRVVALSADTDPVQAPLPDPTVHLETGAKPADLNVQIVASGADEQTFECKVQTSLLPAYEDGVAEPWRLSSLAGDFVHQQMAQFVKASDNWSRTVALRAAGQKLFAAAPRLFQKVFWELVDAGKLPKTISVITEEPSMPWELMVPNRRLQNGEVQKLPPLGVGAIISRWTSQQHVLPAQRLALRDAYVIAPRDSKLGAAEDEAAMVIAQFHGERIDPASPRALDQALEKRSRALLHFVCHGKANDGGSQVLFLDQRHALRADSLSGMDGLGKGLSTGKPLVFLNACEVGRQEPALVGAGGFAEELMALGVSAVIAPLWSVKDTVAHEIAVTFYQRLQAEPATPLAAILRDLRAKSYVAGGGEDSYAAYCFYGDPLATAG